ncbi:YkvA family protein [Tenggerimyces flavus]|uniref:YkvA family protein n=1 Tax=Tenggerimyces flavus TaxID=1708749 RepID=A0ABV7YCW1_9ACTN|nr:YkvA family protein [Tenggerimyces flavus]
MRIRLGLLTVYLAIPIDLIPDFIPILSYAITVAAVLRGIVERTGPAGHTPTLARHRRWIRRAIPTHRVGTDQRQLRRPPVMPPRSWIVTAFGPPCEPDCQ